MSSSPDGFGLGLEAPVAEEEEHAAGIAGPSVPSLAGLSRLRSLPDSPTRRRGGDGTASLASSSFLSPLRSRSRVGSHLDPDGASDYADSIVDAADQSLSMLSTADPAEIDELEEGVRQSRTIEDFTKIITEFRLNRKSAYAESLAVNTETGSQYGARSEAGSDAGSVAPSRRRSVSGESEYGAQPRARCTCCCSQEDCPSAIRARQEWRDLEADLRLSAEIGQALLKRHDAMHAKSQKQAQEYIQQRDGLMSRLTKSYKETSGLERQLAQANLNLEAADSSNRTLLHELDEVRSQLAKLKASQSKLSGAEERARRAASQLDDAQQEAAAERKRADAAEAKVKKLAARNAQLADALHHAKKEVEIAAIRRDAKVSVSEEALEAARQRLALGLKQGRRQGDGGVPSGEGEGNEDDGVVAGVVDSLVRDNEALRQDNAQLKELLDARNEELATLRDQDAGSVQDAAASPRPSLRSRPPSSLGFGSSYRVPTSLARSVDDGEGGPDGREEAEDGSGAAPEPRPVALSDEVVVAAASTNEAGISGHPPGVTVTRTPSTVAGRTHPARSLSRSSATSSSNAAAALLDGLQDSPRSIATGMLSPTVSAATTLQSEGGAALRRQTVSRTETGESGAGPTTGEFDTYLAETAKRERDTRTGQLSTLLDYIQRLFARLSSADVDTLTRRLQRQHLAGDVGHLARTTVNSILRDVDGLREHFRRLIEQESRQNARDDASMGSRDLSNESMVSRKEFFALLKAFRDILCELAKLRTCINEIHMSPGQAAKLLQEHLGATAAEDRSLLPIPSAVGWLGKMLLGGPSPSASTGGHASAAAAGAGGGSAGTGLGGGRGAVESIIGGKLGLGGGSSGSGAMGAGKAGQPSRAAGGASTSGGRMQPSRAVSGGTTFASHLAPRASAAVVSSSVAVEVKGLHASAAEGRSPAGTTAPSSPPLEGGGLKAGPRPTRGRAPGSLSRVQSRNLSGLFAGTLGNPDGFGTSPSPRGVPLYSTRRDASALGSSLLNRSGGPTGGPSASHRPLSRIVDDDELSLHHGRARRAALDDNDDDDDDDEQQQQRSYPGALLDRTLRPRGLSDSSIRSTFLDHAASAGGPTGASAVSRIITPATLALQYSAKAATAEAVKVPGEEDGRSDESGSAASGTGKVTSRGGGPTGTGTVERVVRQVPSVTALGKAAAVAERVDEAVYGTRLSSGSRGAF